MEVDHLVVIHVDVHSVHFLVRNEVMPTARIHNELLVPFFNGHSDTHNVPFHPKLPGHMLDVLLHEHLFVHITIAVIHHPDFDISLGTNDDVHFIHIDIIIVRMIAMAFARTFASRLVYTHCSSLFNSSEDLPILLCGLKLGDFLSH